MFLLVLRYFDQIIYMTANSAGYLQVGKRHRLFALTVCGQETAVRDRKILLCRTSSQTGSGTLPEVVIIYVCCNRILKRCHSFVVSPARTLLTRKTSCDVVRFCRLVAAIRWTCLLRLLSLRLRGGGGGVLIYKIVRRLVPQASNSHCHYYECLRSHPSQYISHHFYVIEGQNLVVKFFCGAEKYHDRNEKFS